MQTTTAPVLDFDDPFGVMGEHYMTAEEDAAATAEEAHAQRAIENAYASGCDTRYGTPRHITPVLRAARTDALIRAGLPKGVAHLY